MRNLRCWLVGFVAPGVMLTATSLARADRPTLGLIPIEPATPAVETTDSAPPPAKDAKPAVADETCSDCCGGFDFKKVPPVRIFPRPGNFFILPSGPGYYSLMDVVTDNYREKAPKYPYSPIAIMPPPLYEADFRYLDDPKNTQHDPFDVLHRIHLGDNFLFSTGGEAWYRLMNEVDSRLSGKDNRYDQFRMRVYGDLWFRDVFRIYGEFITAQMFNYDLKPLAIDRNYADIQNLFADLKLADIDCYPLYVRGGRQEVMLGSQRLISALDWANTRRTFDGVRVFRQGEKFDVDLFWLQFVKPVPTQLDSHDNNQNFIGGWFTYRPEKGHFIDLYYLWLDNTNKTVTKTPPAGFPLAVAPYNVHTIGTRYTGDKNHVLWDAEGMVQWGERGKEDIMAGAATAGAGYNFHCLPMNPTVWAYFDYASGDRSPNVDDYNTFNQLYPFGHYYFGFLDLVGRQNIQDLNFHLYLYPTKWITFNAQFHHFRLDAASDALYSAGAAPLRINPTGASGKDVGNELDLVANFHLGAHSDIFVGWSKLWAGDFITTTGNGRDPELFYFLYNVRW